MESLLPYMEKGRIEAGCDEAGRGPLAGSVFAAAVILPPDFFHPVLNDSKQLTEKQRDMLRPIIEAEAVAWKVEELSPGEIDELNILWASVTGMQRAVLGLAVVPDFLLIDGNRFRPFGTEALTNTAEARCRAAADRVGGNIRFGTDRYATVVKGDATYASIAAASVLAKTYRDAYMRRIAAEYPGYGWEKNMGYPTPDHIEAIRRLGYTPYHRRSFHPSALEPTLF